MNILKDSAIYLIGELISKALPFLLLPYLTRKLGTVGFGELSLYLTLLALISIFVGFSQDGAIARYYYFYGKRSLPLLIRTGLVYNLLLSGIGLVLCWMFRNELLAYVVLIAMFTSILNVQLTLRQCQKQPIPYVTILLINNIAMALLTVVFLEYLPGDQVANRLLAILISCAVTVGITLMYINKRFQSTKRFSWHAYRTVGWYLLSFGLPLIFHQLSFFAKGQLDRLFIYEQHTTAELGIYSAGAQLASILPILLMAINKAVVPYYYAALKEQRLSIQTIRRWCLLAIALCALPALVSWLLPNSLFTWLLGAAFAASHDYTTVFLLGYGATLPYLILVNYFFYHGANKLIASTTFLSAVVYTLLLLYFNQISLKWVPYALLLSNILTVMMLWVLTYTTKKS